MTGRVPVADLEQFAAALLRAVEVPPADAAVTARRLVEADLRGRTGHGLIRLVPYLERIRSGGINPRPAIGVRRDTGVSALVDGDNGLGQVVVTAAVDLALAKAADIGLAWVGTVRSNHAGAAGIYPAMIARRGFVGIYGAVGNANAMPAWGGRDVLLGTNPLAIGVPVPGGHPFVLDIATTAASHGTIKVAARAGEPLPEGWVADTEGRSITDPARVEEGHLLPMGGYKGSGLAMVIGLLAGVLNGAAFGRDVVDHRTDATTPTNTGQMILVARSDLFVGEGELAASLARHLHDLRHSGPDGAEVRLPGDRAAALEEEHTRLGLPVPDRLRAELDVTAAHLGVAARLAPSRPDPRSDQEPTR